MHLLSNLELFLLLLLAGVTIALVAWDRQLQHALNDRDDARAHAIEAESRSAAANARTNRLERKLRDTEMRLHPSFQTPAGEQLAAEAETYLRSQQ